MIWHILCLSALSTACYAKLVEYDWELSYKTLSPNGVNKTMAVVNGQFPGPTLRASVGDTVRVTLRNNLPDNGTSIHFHGVNQIGTPWSDGVPAINQCPIPNSGGVFTYEFTPDEAGTSFWHSHYGPQYPLGVVGPTIIDDPNEPYIYDEEYTIVVTDHYNISEWTLAAIDRTPSPVGFKGIPPRPPPPDALLICSSSGSCNTSNAAQAQSGPALTFEPGKTYRIRFINMSAFVGFHVSIDEHPLRLIGSDFNALNGETSVEVLPIWPAQRYDVLVKAKEDIDLGNVWLRATGQNACYPIQNPNLDRAAKAKIHYIGVDESLSPTTSAYADPADNNCRDLDLDLLVPREHQSASSNPDQTIRLGVGLIVNSTARQIQGVVNGNSFPAEDFSINPTLFSIHDGVNVTQLPSNRNAYELVNGTIRIVLNTTVGPGAHPYHLHGHSFQLLGYLNGSYDDSNPNQGLNLINPPRRDTAMVPVNATAVFQFETNNAGVQFFHCHMDWHLIEGLAAQFVELPAVIRQMRIPDAARELCSAQPGNRRNRSDSF